MTVKLVNQVARQSLFVIKTNHHYFVDKRIEILSKELISVKGFLTWGLGTHNGSG